ncbi:Bax inhibitor-1/YccA family protein [Candidatus Nomurabacteria bacterium]|nr:Bax inhibitor-1/YccA family protein [Candidatus Nomurabacteria bacterium]
MENTQYRNRRMGAYLSQQEFFEKTFLLMGLGLLITAAIAYYIALDTANMAALFNTFETINDEGETVTEFSASGWWWLAAIGQLGMVLVISGRSSMANMSAGTGTVLFVIFAALNGITIAPVLYAYTAASVAKVFLITSITFGGCALWGMTTKRDLTGMGTFFLYALIGLLVTMIVNAFFGSPTMDYVISFAAILLFAALTAFDMQKLCQMHGERMDHSGLVVYGALTLYLDFINLFLHLLRFFGVKKD